MSTTKKSKAKEKTLLRKRVHSDFIELMLEVNPFVKKSTIIINSTEGKWYDATTAPIDCEEVVLQNSNYR